MINRIVLVSNIETYVNNTSIATGSHHEDGRKDTIKFLENNLKDFCNNLVVYLSAEDFIDNIHQHKNDLIFPFYHVGMSRNRAGQIQAVCEAYDVKFVGADSYTLLVCNDKQLTKELCRLSGIDTIKSDIYFGDVCKYDYTHLNLPIIVKPMFEGDSIGINDDNVLYNYSDITEKANSLFCQHSQPVIVEEYIDGEELFICAIGCGKEVQNLGAVRIKLDKEKYKTFSFDLKHKYFNNDMYQIDNDIITPSITKKVENLFLMLDKVESIRLDFILKEEKLYCFELTPAYALSADCGFFMPFLNKLCSKQILELLISNALKHYQNLSSN